MTKIAKVMTSSLAVQTDEGFLTMGTREKKRAGIAVFRGARRGCCTGDRRDRGGSPGGLEQATESTVASVLLAAKQRSGYKRGRRRRVGDSVSIARRVRNPEERFSPTSFYALCPPGRSSATHTVSPGGHNA